MDVALVAQTVHFGVFQHDLKNGKVEIGDNLNIFGSSLHCRIWTKFLGMINYYEN